MVVLGEGYAVGSGVKVDFKMAMFWFKKAASAGNADAMVEVGSLYRFGMGVPQDTNKAKFWYEKTAAAGNPLGKKFLKDLQMAESATRPATTGK